MNPNNPAGNRAASGRSNRPIGLVVWLSILMTLYGCAGWIRPAEHDETALLQVNRWVAHNAELEHFKGLLQVRIQVRGQTINGRAAIAGAVPDQLRLEFLSFIGQPLLSVAGDGRTITMIDMQEGTIHRMAQTERSMERIVGMPLSVRHLLEVLLGRPPVPEFGAAIWSQETVPGCAVQLTSRWYDLLADIRSEACEHPDVLNIYDREGKLDYTIHWLQWQVFQGYVLPRRVMITSAEGARIEFTTERFWPDTPLPPSTFVLEPPGH
jgi:outer membrane biogenesis lipoprotein LolB